MRILKAVFAAALGGVSAAAAAGDPGAAAKAINEFGAELHQRLVRKSGENLCLSPYSIQTALGMTFAGTDGDTRDEMAKVLHFGKGHAIHGSFAALQEA